MRKTVAIVLCVSAMLAATVLAFADAYHFALSRFGFKFVSTDDSLLCVVLNDSSDVGVLDGVFSDRYGNYEGWTPLESRFEAEIGDNGGKAVFTGITRAGAACFDQAVLKGGSLLFEKTDGKIPVVVCGNKFRNKQEGDTFEFESEGVVREAVIVGKADSLIMAPCVNDVFGTFTRIDAAQGEVFLSYEYCEPVREYAFVFSGKTETADLRDIAAEMQKYGELSSLADYSTLEIRSANIHSAENDIFAYGYIISAVVLIALSGVIAALTGKRFLKNKFLWAATSAGIALVAYMVYAAVGSLLSDTVYVYAAREALWAFVAAALWYAACALISRRTEDAKTKITCGAAAAFSAAPAPVFFVLMLAVCPLYTGRIVTSFEQEFFVMYDLVAGLTTASVFLAELWLLWVYYQSGRGLVQSRATGIIIILPAVFFVIAAVSALAAIDFIVTDMKIPAMITAFVMPVTAWVYTWVKNRIFAKSGKSVKAKSSFDSRDKINFEKVLEGLTASGAKEGNND